MKPCGKHIAVLGVPANLATGKVCAAEPQMADLPELYCVDCHGGDVNKGDLDLEDIA